MTVWDTTADAAEFVRALPVLTDGAHVEQRDARVLALLGPSRGGPPDLAALAAATWQKTRFERPPLPGR
jgi:hypothetical protein